MATTPLTLEAERWLDELILKGSVADVAVNSINEQFSLPAGLGDVAVLSCQVSISVVGTTPVAAATARGVIGAILSSDGSAFVDLLGSVEWLGTSGVGAAFTRFDAYLDPDALALWRQTELLTIVAPEMDAGATGDLSVRVKVVRVRPLEQPVPHLQLVR